MEGDEEGERMRTKGQTRNDCEQLTILYSIRPTGSRRKEAAHVKGVQWEVDMRTLQHEA